MAQDEFWIKKIRAFLLTPPDASLFSNESVERAKDLIAAALGDSGNGIDLSELAEVKNIAAGLDIPPFVKKFSFMPDEFLQAPVFKHPLSGAEIKIDLNPAGIEKEKTHQLIKEAISQIRKQTGETSLDYQKLYLFLWRYLPDIIRQIENYDQKFSTLGIGKYWDWLPADPRVPTHSVWEHSAIASAIAGAGSNPALLIFTIASPQEFISTARRTQDSWMGSFLYSFLMWEAIKSIADEFGPDCFLFPELRRQPLVDKWLEVEKGITGLALHPESAFQIANFPNMLTAILPIDKAADAAGEAHRAMKKKWKEIARIINEKIDYTLGNKLNVENTDNWKRIWDRQVEDFLNQNIFWVACPWQDGGKNVVEVYRQLFPGEGNSKKRIDEFERLLNTVPPDEANPGMLYQCFSSIASRALTARKNLRDFHNHHKEEGEKCSLCGLRETLHPDSKTHTPARYRDQRLFWLRLGNIKEFRINVENAGIYNERVKFAGRIKRGDALCSVCLIKRLALDFYFNEKRDNGFSFDRHLFPSTSMISTAPFKAKIIDWSKENANNLKIIRNYNRAVKKFLRKINQDYPAFTVPKLKRKQEEFSGRAAAVIRSFLQLDGQWLFKDSFFSVENELPEKISNNSLLEKLRDEAVKSLEELLKNFAKQSETVKPSSYYAVISMDGDKIGEWLSGRQAPAIESLLHPRATDEIIKDPALKSLIEKNRPLGAISHLSLSVALKNFALEIAPRIIEEENYGKLIFAGGDDLLAFVPTENLLKVVDQLHKFFQGENFELAGSGLSAENGVVRINIRSEPERNILVAGTIPIKKDLDDNQKSRLTASIGVAIIHHSYPLPQAIEEAFTGAMKNHAKEQLGRNAVALHLLKRAGNPLKVGFKFDEFDDLGGALSLMQEVLNFIKDGFLSARIAYAMNKRKAGLEGNWNDISADLTEKTVWWHEAQVHALRYLISRQAKKSMIIEIEKRLVPLLEILYRSFRKPVDDASPDKKREAIEELIKKKTDTGWDTLTGLLLLLSFLAGEVQGNS